MRQLETKLPIDKEGQGQFPNKTENTIHQGPHKVSRLKNSTGDKHFY